VPVNSFAEYRLRVLDDRAERGRTQHVCSDRRDEGPKPTRRARVRSVAEGSSVGQAQTRARSMKQEWSEFPFTCERED
jgi:hypothetical protein